MPGDDPSPQRAVTLTPTKRPAPRGSTAGGRGDGPVGGGFPRVRRRGGPGPTHDPGAQARPASPWSPSPTGAGRSHGPRGRDGRRPGRSRPGRRWPAAGTRGWALALLGFFVGRAAILSDLDPFGLSLVASFGLVARREAAWVALATMAGVGHRAGPAAAAAFGLQAVAVAAAFALWRRRWGVLDRPAAAGVVAVTAFVASLPAPGSWTLPGLVPAGFQAGLAGLLTVLFTQGLAAVVARDVARWAGADPAGLLVLAAAAVAGAARFRIADLELADILAGAAVAGVGAASGPAAGAVAGLSAGAVAALVGPFDPAALGAAGLAGLVAGAFRDFGRAGAAAAYVLGRLAVVLAAPATGAFVPGGPDGPWAGVLAGAAGAGLVALVPRSAWEPVRAWLAGVAGPAPRAGRDLHAEAARRIQHFAAVCSDLARAFKEASPAAAAGTAGGPAGTTGTAEAATGTPANAAPGAPHSADPLVAALTERLCQRCAYYRSCWEQHFFQLHKGTLELLARLEQAGPDAPDDVPAELRRHCRYLDEFVLHAAHLTEVARRDRTWQRRLADLATVIPAQLEGLAAALDGLVRELEGPAGAAVAVEARVADHLRGVGEPVARLTAEAPSPGRLEFTIARHPCETGDACRVRVTPEVGRALGRPVSLVEEGCTWELGAPTCTFHVTASPAIRCRVRAREAVKAGMTVSGDSYVVRETGDGRLLAILSDGTGSGGSAASLSRATVGLVERLLAAGLPTDWVVRTANAVLLARSATDRYSTVDVAVVDLHTATAELLKRGAAPAYLRRAGGLEVIQLPSLPLGVAPEPDTAPAAVGLRRGDLLLLATDGLWGPDGPVRGRRDWVARLLERMTGAGPDEVADALLSEALRRQAGAWADDVTVIAIAVEAAGEPTSCGSGRRTPGRAAVQMSEDRRPGE